MDQERFDRIARALGTSGSRRAGLRAALGAMGLFAGGAVAADAKGRHRGAGRSDGPAAAKRRHECGPDAPCPAGFECARQGRRRRCSCASGVLCDGSCCATGEVCQDGSCADVSTCIGPGQPCKDTGRPCCGGRVCSSGQGGQDDVACYAPKTGACATTADCVYAMTCRDGVCSRPQDADGLGTPCSPASQQSCAYPGASCTTYTGEGAPEGAHCTLPLQKSCTGDPQCTCYKCWYTTATTTPAGRRGRSSANTKACCHPAGQACAVEQDCCLGLECVNGMCGGTICVPDDASGCDASTPCCTGASCVGGVCLSCQGCLDAQQICQPGTTQAACGPIGSTCATCTGATCVSGACVPCAGCIEGGQICQAGTTPAACGASGGPCDVCTTGVRCCVTGSCVVPTSYPDYRFPFPPNTAIINTPYDVVMTSNGLQAIASGFASNSFNGNLLTVWSRPTTAPNTWVYKYQLNIGSGLRGAWGLWLSADALTLYVAEWSSRKVSVWERLSVSDTNNWTQQANSPIDVPGVGPSVPVASADQLTLYVAFQSDVDGGGLKVYTRAAIGEAWSEQSMYRNETVLIRPKGLAVSADGLTAWVAEGVGAGSEIHNIVILTRATTGESFTFSGQTISTNGLRPVYGLWLSPDERTLYVTGGGISGKLQIYTRSSTALQDWTLRSSLPGGTLAYGNSGTGGVAVTPDGANILVAVSGANGIYGFDPVCS